MFRAFDTSRPRFSVLAFALFAATAAGGDAINHAAVSPSILSVRIGFNVIMGDLDRAATLAELRTAVEKTCPYTSQS